MMRVFRKTTIASMFAASALWSSAIYAEQEINPEFIKWVDEYDIELNNGNLAEMLANWLENDRFITVENSKEFTHTLGHNQFSGMSGTDYSAYLHRTNKYNYTTQFDTEHWSVVDLEPSVNWVEKGGVTPVKNQGQCGSCWSFSTTGALEGAFFVKTGNLVSFSEQQLVDCDNSENGGSDQGCNGGLMSSAFDWIGKNGGLCAETDYAYESGDTKVQNSCKKVCTPVADSKVSRYVSVAASDDMQMMTALSYTPVAIAIEADQRRFQFYKSGVFTGDCGTSLDHGVLAVGYGSENGQDYYLVKNSWGTSWGDGGYIKLGRGAEFNKGSGQCGMLLQANYPVLEQPTASTVK